MNGKLERLPGESGANGSIDGDDGRPAAGAGAAEGDVVVDLGVVLHVDRVNHEAAPEVQVVLGEETGAGERSQ